MLVRPRAGGDLGGVTEGFRKTAEAPAFAGEQQP